MSRWGTFLVLSGLVFGPAPGARAQDAGAAGVKANLDLPYQPGGEDGDEEDAPEAIVFYGQMFEGTGFLFCCDKMC